MFLVGAAVALGAADVVLLEEAEQSLLSPEEEAAALQAEDHDANIKKIEAQEMAKARLKAKTKQKIPESVECYWNLEQQAADQKALSEKYANIAKNAHSKFDKATAAKEKAFTEVQGLRKRHHRERSAMEDAQQSYKLEHTKATNAYDTAKGNLDNYNVERKKVDMDAARSKSVLTTYLKYKKSYITASADAHSPAQSREVSQYQKLSSQYLKSYHALQAKIKTSYGAATKYQSLYKYCRSDTKNSQQTQMRLLDRWPSWVTPWRRRASS